MKKIMFAIAASSLIATPLFAQPGPNPQPGKPHAGSQHHPDYKRPDQYRPAPPKVKAPPKHHAYQFKRGERFHRAKATNYRVINNPRAYRLQPAPRGYRWVQSGRDALLVRLSNNVIVQVARNVVR